MNKDGVENPKTPVSVLYMKDLLQSENQVCCSVQSAAP